MEMLELASAQPAAPGSLAEAVQSALPLRVPRF